MKKLIYTLMFLFVSACSNNSSTNNPAAEPDDVYNLDAVNEISYKVDGQEQSYINLGQVIKGSRSKAVVVVSNLSQNPFTISSVSVSSNYFLSSSNCSGKLAPSASCSLTINLSTVDKSLGLVPGSLTFGASSVVISSEVVTAPAPAPAQIITLDSNNQSLSAPLFLGNYTDSRRLSKTIVFKNVGSVSTGSLNLSLSNNSDQWYVVSNSCSNKILVAGGLCQAVLRVKTSSATGLHSVTMSLGEFSSVVSFSKNLSSPGSCLEAKNMGALNSQGNSGDGIYSLHNSAGDYQAYCDQTTDGGGWTLVMKGRSATSAQDYNNGWYTQIGDYRLADQFNDAASFKFNDGMINSLKTSRIRIVPTGIAPMYLSAACVYQHSVTPTAFTPCTTAYSEVGLVNISQQAQSGVCPWHHGITTFGCGGSYIAFVTSHSVSAVAWGGTSGNNQDFDFFVR